MTTDRKDWYVRLVERLGISTIILGFVGYAVWTVMTWAGPRVDRLLEKHVEIVDKAIETSQKNTETMRVNAETLKVVGDAVEQQARMIGDHDAKKFEKLEAIHTDVKAVKAAVEKSVPKEKS